MSIRRHEKETATAQQQLAEIEKQRSMLEKHLARAQEEVEEERRLVRVAFFSVYPHFFLELHDFNVDLL